jgi:hypothetical protein
MRYTPLPTPDELGIDRHYRLAHYSKFPREDFKPHIDGIVQQQILRSPQKRKLFRFLEWSLEKGYIKPPCFPDAEVHGLGYDYYRKLDACMREAAESNRSALARAAEDYYQETNIKIHTQHLPVTPSPLWLGVMEGTSIAMGQLKSGVEWDPFTLSSLGVVWRSETIRSLIDSLKAADQNPAFAAYCLHDPDMLPCYFMSVHDEIYTCGKVRFQDLPASDMNLLIKAATSQQRTAPCQVIMRAGQLLRQMANGPWDAEYMASLWKNDLSANMNAKYRAENYRMDLPEEMHELLERIYQQNHPCDFTQLGFPPHRRNLQLCATLQNHVDRQQQSTERGL